MVEAITIFGELDGGIYKSTYTYAVLHGMEYDF